MYEIGQNDTRRIADRLCTEPYDHPAGPGIKPSQSGRDGRRWSNAIVHTRTASRGTRLLARIVLLSAIAAVLAVVESYLPRPVPWARLGLGHTGVLIALWIDGAGAALGVLLLKTILSGLVGGTLFHPTALVGIVAGCSSWLVMSIGHSLISKKHLGPVGISAVGAFIYGLVQISLYGWWLAGHPLWDLGPVVMVPGVLAGIVTGALAALVLVRLESSLRPAPVRREE